jgi:hypothetical protein
MTAKSFVKSAALAALIAATATPAFADSRDHDEHARARGNVNTARSDNQRATAGHATERRGYDVSRTEHAAPRAAEPVRPSYEQRSYAVPRYEAPHYAAPRYYAAPRAYYAPRYYATPRIFVPRPYHPGFSFGIFFGTPYPYRWAYPVYVPVPYGYPAYSIPRGVAYGGISFGGLTPYDAAVFVDGTYVGVASTFDGTRQPLTLAAGRHRIELQAQGYAPIAFDVDVVPGQVIPYQGGLPSGY